MKNFSLLFVLLFLIVLIIINDFFALFFKSIFKNSTEIRKVVKVIDGDTFLTDKNEKIRLIGVDAPEINEKCYREAKNILKELIEGKLVKLEKDTKETDKFGRLLRYVYINDTLVNLILIKEGFAYFYMDNFNMKYSKELYEAEKYAKENKIGCLWKN